MGNGRRVFVQVLIAALCCSVLTVVISGCDLRGEAVIEVSCSGDPIEDAATFHFGSCTGASLIEKKFELRNEGTKDAEIVDINVTNTNGSAFDLMTTYRGSLEPGGTKTFDVSFGPTATGEYSAHVRIDIADSDDDFNFTVTGNGIDDNEVKAPTGLTATAQSATTIRLDWTDNSDNETGFRVERSPDGSSGWTDVTTTAADVLRYDDTGLAVDTTYWYRVCATSGGGDTEFSNTASATTEADVTDPTLSVTNLPAGGELKSGFIVGTASDDVSLSAVEVRLDGGSWQNATGTDSWSYSLPTGTSIWKLRSSHSIDVRARDGSNNYSTTFSATVIKGVNKDTNGNGYIDLVIGASGYSDSGKIYLYNGSSSGLSSSSSLDRLGSSGDAFGWAVAVSDFDGDGFADVAVGAPASSSYTGSVSVFYGSVSGISSTGTALATGEGTNNYFGEELATGDFDNDGYADLAVGASGYSSDTGRATIYHGSDSGLSATASQTLTGSSNSSFGKALATGDVNGDGYCDLAVGAQGYDPGSASGTGAVYVHHGGVTGIPGSPDKTLLGEAALDSFGASVAIGNANGDGYDDLAVGADGHNVSTGRAYVYHGISGGIGSAPIRTLDGGAQGDSFGATVVMGNFNGDDYDDLAVGADGHSSFTGRVSVYDGGSGGIESSASQTLTGESSSHFFGDALSAGDADLDGNDELVVSAAFYDGPTYTNRGKVYLYDGSSSGIPSASARTWTGTDTADGEKFGFATGF